MEDFNFDDDVFTASSERKVIPLITDYQAKEETDGWFQNLGDPRQLMLAKLGPVQFKHAIEHDYLHGRYQQALDKALLYINITTYEVGSLLVKGRFYPMCNRSPEAISCLVEYSKQRKRDYNVWRLISDACMMDSHKGPIMLHLAHLAIVRAIRIMTSFNWRMDIPVVKQRYQKEKDTLDQKRDKIEQQGGSVDQLVEWIKANDNRCSLDDYNWDDIMWMYQDWMAHLNDTGASLEEDEDEGGKAVKDM
ncbi:hypothetical protein BC941DRAFT_356382 [Chlamydoabsidia padenii]|nr:hypothetical protein BC941DRAFT_356382 [Chlamydoabsidia padenii]